MKRVLSEYVLPDLYEPKRWMCGRCGLILDYLFNVGDAGWPVFNPPDMFVDEKENVIIQETSQKELCPRCNADFDQILLIPVMVSEVAIKPFTKTTFIVEDEAHEIVLHNIAKQLGKDIDIMPLGVSENVKRFFEQLKKKDSLKNSYFMIDGDNKQKIHPQEERFIHLEKYCVENYLIDFQICAILTNQTIGEFKIFFLKLIQKELIAQAKDKASVVVANMLTIDHLTEHLLAQLDASSLLKGLCKEYSLSKDKYIERYVEECFSRSKEMLILPNRVVEIIRDSWEALC